MTAYQPSGGSASGLESGVRAARLEPLLAAATLVVAVFAAYARSFSGPFVFLDVAAILDNPTIRHLWPIWDCLRPPHVPGITVEGRPLVNLTLALNYALSGTTVWSYHAFNVALHAASALVLFGIVRRTLGSLGMRQAEVAGWLVALLWALHPLQTESVNYVVQRAESLMGLLYLTTLYGFIRAVGVTGARGRLAWLAFSFFACLLGMAAKEVMASAPAIVFLYDRTFVSGGWIEAWRRRWAYYLALAATWAPLAWLVHSTGGNRGGTSGFGIGVTWTAYLLTQGPAILRYLRLSLWPSPLIFYYEVRWFRPGEVAFECASVALLAAATAVAVWRRRPAGFLGAWFFAILAPTSLIPGMSQTIAEHRMYLPLAAVLVGLVLAVRGIANRLGLPNFAWTGALLLAGVALGTLTFRRAAAYSSEVALWTDTVAKAPGNPYSRNNLGIALASAGRTAEAIGQLETVIREDGNYAEAHDNLGLALAESGRLPEAIAEYGNAIRLKGDYPEAIANLGVALAASGRYLDAIEQFQRAVELKPEYMAARNNLAAALATVGRLPEAIAQYRRVLEQDPASAETLYNLGNSLAKSGQWGEAAASYGRAVELQPKNADAQANLGVALATLGKFSEAVPAYERALALAPNDPDLHQNLGLALRELGRAPEADAQFAAAARLRGVR